MTTQELEDLATIEDAENEWGSVGWDDHDASEWARECREED